MNEFPAKSEDFVIEDDAQTPKEGTLAWLELQPHTTVLGLELPDVHRVPADAELAPDDGRNCRVIRPDGERCGAPRTRAYGVCLVHAGGGAQDHVAMSRAGHAAKARIRQRRTLLGIGARRAGEPRQIARVAALAHSEQLAAALLEPVLDPELGSMARQAAAIKVLDATYPIQTATLELELPADELGMQGLSWQDMQAMAQRVLGYQGEPAELEP